MEAWKNFNQRSFPEKEYCYSHLKIEDVTDATTRTKKEFIKILK